MIFIIIKIFVYMMAKWKQHCSNSIGERLTTRKPRPISEKILGLANLHLCIDMNFEVVCIYWFYGNLKIFLHKILAYNSAYTCSIVRLNVLVLCIWFMSNFCAHFLFFRHIQPYPISGHPSTSIRGACVLTSAVWHLLGRVNG